MDTEKHEKDFLNLTENTNLIGGKLTININ